MDQVYERLLGQGIFELGEAFKGLADQNVWRRPAEGLLSIGEIAGHMAYWEAVRFAGEGEDLDKCKVASPLIDPLFRYHTATLANPPSERHRGMSAEQVSRELVRVHEESVRHFNTLNPDMESNVPGLPEYWTYRSSLEYLLFHIAYHVGQIYTVRHLLGEQPPDN